MNSLNDLSNEVDAEDAGTDGAGNAEERAHRCFLEGHVKISGCLSPIGSTWLVQAMVESVQSAADPAAALMVSVVACGLHVATKARPSVCASVFAELILLGEQEARGVLEAYRELVMSLPEPSRKALLADSGPLARQVEEALEDIPSIGEQAEEYLAMLRFLCRGGRRARRGIRRGPCRVTGTGEGARA